MLKNYLRTALRTLARNKLYSGLNIAGMTFGMTCFLLIGLYVFDELTFDSQHAHADRIYRVIEHKTVNGESTTIAAAGYQLAEQSRKKIPAVDNTTVVRRTGRANIVNPENPANFFQETVTIADEQFLQIFDFPLLEGERKTALKEPNTIIITEDLARRLFNRTDVMGRTLKFSFMKSPMKITGILKNHPRNSSFDFSSVLSDKSFQMDEGYRAMEAHDWLSENFSVYALLKSNSHAGSVAGQMSNLVHENSTAPAGTNFYYGLQSLKDIHLHSAQIVDGARNSNVDPIAQGSLLYVKIFSFIAFFVLAIAGINYVNLTTARTSSRMKEIGVRKTIGAGQNNLIGQFLFESVLVTCISFLCSIAVVNFLLPAFNQFTYKQLSLGPATDYRIWIYATGFALFTGLLSGSYPALMLSRFKPVLLLRGLQFQNKTGLSLRKGLVVFQFVISIVMIIATIILFQQAKYVNNTDLGFNKNLLIVIDVNTGKARSNFEAVKTEMAKIPTVKNVSVTSRVPGEWKTFHTVKIKNSGNGVDSKIAYMFGADRNFLNTYGIKLLQGRNFDSPSDSSKVMINETAAKLLGIREAAGQMIEIPEMSENGDGTFVPLDNHIPFKPAVIGIVRDFHFQSLRDRIEPLIIGYNQNPVQVIDYYTAKIDGTHVQASLDKLKEVMVTNDKNDPFEYHFLNDQLALFYIDDERRQTILIWAALATIFIASLGLFGLATYSAEQRIKEIGVRRVLGASIFNLASLLSKDFLKLVLIANAIAFPIAGWMVNKWLQEYAYHIDMQWWVFIIAGILAVGISLLTVSFQAIRAAMANPVNSLRSE